MQMFQIHLLAVVIVAIVVGFVVAQHLPIFLIAPLSPFISRAL